MSVFQSHFPLLDFPEPDLFSFIFERNDRPSPPATVSADLNILEQRIFTACVAIFQDAETDRAFSHLDINRATLDFRAGLKARFQWRKGEVLALCAANNIEAPGVGLCILWPRGIVSPANPGCTVRELAYQLQDSGARAIVTQFHLLKTVKKACHLSGIPDDAIILVETSEIPSDKQLIMPA